VPQPKPDPAVLHAAAAALGAAPAECLLVDSGRPGLDAAKAAGMRCIITYSPSSKPKVGGGGEE
jgi:HAD superfamily hydrolase (TIGR01509 family)